VDGVPVWTEDAKDGTAMPCTYRGAKLLWTDPAGCRGYADELGMIDQAVVDGVEG